VPLLQTLKEVSDENEQQLAGFSSIKHKSLGKENDMKCMSRNVERNNFFFREKESFQK